MRSEEREDDLALTLDKEGTPPKPGEAPTGVRRVNNVPLLIIGGVLTVFVVLVAMVAAQRGRGAKEDSDTAPAPLAENSQALDQMLANAAMSGIIEDPDSGRAPSFQVARVDDLDAPPVPDRQGGVVADTGRSNERMKQFQSAMQAKTGVMQPSAGAAVAADRKSGNEPKSEPEAGPPDPRVPVSAEGDYSQFDHKKLAKAQSGDRWGMKTLMEEPRTAYEIRAGSVIPATMISGINSELPGQMIAQVSQDVFDTPTGRHRLIPQGSRLIGRYTNHIIYGQSRLLVAWQRIVFPDGKALDIGAMEGVDSAGYAGFNDVVDRHYLRVFGSASLMSGIAAGLTSSRVTPENDPYGSSTAAIMSQNLAHQVGEVATKMIEKNLDLAPTLKIRPGYRFNVMAVKDLAFEHPYQPFDYR